MKKLVISHKKETNILSKRGKNAKRKGSQYERDIARKFKERYNIDLKRTPLSGGFAKSSEKNDEYKGDITLIDDVKHFVLHIECKNQKNWSLPNWILQASNDCPENKIPIVVFHQYNTSKDFVCISLNDFFSLIDKEKIIKEKGEIF